MGSYPSARKVAPKKEPDVNALCRARAKKILDVLKKNNPKSHALAVDPSPHIGGLSGRRGGKTYTGVSTALATGEAKPGAISLIISLNKKQLKRLYWDGAPSGIHALDRIHNLGLEFHTNDLRWKHQNGSIGYLLGADDDQQLEVIRGLEADLYIIDECKSFAPLVLANLIDNIIDPQRASRNGRLILIGTPGPIHTGRFFEATCPEARDEDGKRVNVGLSPTYEPAPRVDEDGRTPETDLLWSSYHWDVSDNRSMPHQWAAALKKKSSLKLADNDPTWLMEYRGRWVKGGGGASLVFNYAHEKQFGNCTWRPEQTAENPTGLPREGAPWRLIAGLDLGFEAPTAIVVAGYSRKLGQIRHVFDTTKTHLRPAQIAQLLDEIEQRFGVLEQIYADTGNLGKMVVEQLVKDHGFPIERADKREKFDHIELLKDALSSGAMKIIPDTELEIQLLTNAWKCQSNKREVIEDLARRGKLREDDAIPNDLTDALLYMFRGSQHLNEMRTPVPEELEPGSREWERALYKRDLARLRAQESSRYNPITRAPLVVRNAMRNTWTIPTPTWK